MEEGTEMRLRPEVVFVASNLVLIDGRFFLQVLFFRLPFSKLKIVNECSLDVFIMDVETTTANVKKQQQKTSPLLS